MTDATKKSKVEVDPNHGLWAFFHSKDKPMNTPEEDAEHGRAWRAEELRQKSWEDLHAIWWKACRERNVIKTESYERERLGAGYGGSESEGREVTVRGLISFQFLGRGKGWMDGWFWGSGLRLGLG